MLLSVSVSEFRQNMAPDWVDDHTCTSQRYVMEFPFYQNDWVIWILRCLWFLSEHICPCRSKLTVSLKAFCTSVVFLFPHLLLLICDYIGHTYSVVPVWNRCKLKDAETIVSRVMVRAWQQQASSDSKNKEATAVGKTTQSLSWQIKKQPCLGVCRGKHHVSHCFQLHTFWCPPAAIPAPVSAPVPYPALPKCTLLLCSAWAAVVQSHTGLLFDFTSVLRRLRQARPGISAMWLKNGNRSQEYKRRHTGCGSGSLVEEWVVD